MVTVNQEEKFVARMILLATADKGVLAVGARIGDTLWQVTPSALTNAFTNSDNDAFALAFFYCYA